MMKRNLVVAVACLGILAVVVTAQTGKKADPLKFPKCGFAIAPLDEVGEGSVQALMMFMPASDGFAPNVNVQIQEFAGTMEDYRTLSVKQFAEMKLKVISDQLAEGVFTTEYSGTMQGHALHFCAKAIGRNGKVYLATGTAPEGQWKAVGAKLKACVDSLNLLAVEAPAKAPAK
jgi:hypothetical protein